jgi:hypothetical protein
MFFTMEREKDIFKAYDVSKFSNEDWTTLARVSLRLDQISESEPSGFFDQGRKLKNPLPLSHREIDEKVANNLMNTEYEQLEISVFGKKLMEQEKGPYYKEAKATIINNLMKPSLNECGFSKDFIQSYEYSN